MSEIRIDVTDLEEEAQREEADMSSEDAMLAEHVARQWHPFKTGRVALGARSLGIAPEDILPPNKLLLMNGAATAVLKVLQRRYHDAVIGDTTYRSRSWVGTNDGKPDDQGQTFIAADSDGALDRAERYLLDIVPRHIWGRMLIIAEHGGDLEAVAKALHAEIDRMVTELSSDLELVTA